LSLDTNMVILMGRLTKNVDLRTTQTGKFVTTFTIASGNGKDENGVERPADFNMVEVWGAKAKFAADNLSKGRKVLVKGKLKSFSYMKDDEKRYGAKVIAHTIEFADGKAPTNAEAVFGEAEELSEDEFF